MSSPSPLELKVVVEFLTPTFLGGFRPRRVDPYMPLRPASLRGVWRYWFRALAGSLMWPERGAEQKMIQELLKAESRLFGDTSGRSRLVLAPPKLSPPAGQELPARAEIPAQSSGLRYLGYGLYESGSPECIPAGSTGEISCYLRSPQVDRADLRAVCAILWTWATFGGLGGRSRRGYGSVRISSFSGGSELAEVLRPWNELVALQETPKAYFTAVRDGIGRAQDALEAFLKAEQLAAHLQGSATSPHVAIRSLHGLAAVTGLPHTYTRGVEALERVGELFRDFRSTLRRRDRGHPPLPDYFEVKASLTHPFHPPRRVDRAAFGLPLRFYYRSLDGKSTEFRPRPRGGGKHPDRLASPLFLRVFALTKGRYGVALLNLAGKPESPPLQGASMSSRQTEEPIPGPPSLIIDDFIQWAAAQPFSSSRGPR